MNFVDRVLLLTRKLLNQGFLVIRFKSSLLDKRQRIQKGESKMDNPEKLATQTKKNKQKHNIICVGNNYAQANTNNLYHDTWLTVTEYLCYRSPRICPVLLSSSGEETYYHSGIPDLSQRGIKAVVLYIIYETKRRIKESVQLYFI